MKVRAHKAFSSVNGDPEETYRWGGNKIADQHAKLGSRMHPIDERIVEHAKVALGSISQVAMLIARIAVWRLYTYDKVHEHGTAPSFTKKPSPVDVDLHRPCFEGVAMRWRCMRCLSSAETLSTMRRLPCLPVQVLSEHKLWMAGDIFFAGAAVSIRRPGHVGSGSRVQQ